jgi:predicted DNA-binding antitoxin AbrB/MazE fold protein
MMSNLIRVVYENGRLRPLQPLDLVDGQEIEIVILSERDRAVAALGDLLVQVPPPEQDNVDEAALLREIEGAFRGQRPLSESVIDERREGP